MVIIAIKSYDCSDTAYSSTVYQLQTSNQNLLLLHNQRTLYSHPKDPAKDFQLKQPGFLGPDCSPYKLLEAPLAADNQELRALPEPHGPYGPF